MIRISILAGLLVVIALPPVLLGTDARAHSEASGIVKERMDAMKTMGKAIKTLAKMISGETAYDPATARELATDIGRHGGDAMTRLFPNGSLQHPTEALPVIWTDWNRFSALAADVSERAGLLAQSETPDKAALKRLADTCSACHRDFRERD